MNTEQPTTTPEADLAALEQRAIDGESVTPEELTNAREKVTLAGLFRKGQTARQEAAERQAAAAQRENAKREAAALLADLDDRAETAAADILAAVSALTAAVSERNHAIEEAARILDRAGLPSPDYSLRDVLDVPGLDRENFASWGHGMQLHYVMIAGVNHSPVPVGQKVVKALGEAVRAVHLGRSVEITS